MDKKSMNVKPEAAWSTLRRNFTPAFEDMLDKGQDIYDVLNPLQQCVLYLALAIWVII
jgi:hypothetical protein